MNDVAQLSLPKFDGETYQPELDRDRLTIQLEKVKALMLSENAWLTLEEIQLATGIRSSASVSARIRDLRKKRFGQYLVERRRRFEGGGLFEYRARVNPDANRQENETAISACPEEQR